MGSLGIAINGGRYVRVDSSINDMYRTVRLRTIRAGQDSAKLDFYVFRKKGPVVRKSVLLKDLSQNGDTPAELTLKVERRSFAVWEITARKHDGTVKNIRVRTGIGLWPLLIAAVALLLFGGWLLFRLVGGDSPVVSSPVSTVSEITEKIEPAEPPQLIESEPVETPAPQFPTQTIVYFRPESAKLSNAAMAELKTLAGLVPEGISIEISGHCANYGTERGRRVLSRLRADVVADYLSGLIPFSVSIEVKGYGGSRPLNRDPELQDVNRRVEINLSGDGG